MENPRPKKATPHSESSILLLLGELPAYYVMAPDLERAAKLDAAAKLALPAVLALLADLR